MHVLFCLPAKFQMQEKKPSIPSSRAQESKSEKSYVVYHKGEKVQCEQELHPCRLPCVFVNWSVIESKLADCSSKIVPSIPVGSPLPCVLRYARDVLA